MSWENGSGRVGETGAGCGYYETGEGARAPSNQVTFLQHYCFHMLA